MLGSQKKTSLEDTQSKKQVEGRIEPHSEMNASTSKLDSSKKKSIAAFQVLSFGLTYLAYSCIHATRTAWSSSKQSLKEDMDEKTNHFVAMVDTCFLLSYAISMKTLGSYSSRFPIQFSLGFGMVSSAICLLLIYFICQVSLNKGFILFMMMLNGISQSTGWPSVVACMGNWFGNGKKGALMGIWGTCGNLGNVIGYFLQALVVNGLELNWKFVLFFMGIILLTLGSYLAFNLKAYPYQVGISEEDLLAFNSLEEKQNHQKFHDQFEEEQGKSKEAVILGIDPKLIDKENHASSSTYQGHSNSNNTPPSLPEEGHSQMVQIGGIEKTIKEVQEIHNDFQQNDQIKVIILQNNQKNPLNHQEIQINFWNAWTRVPGLALFALTMGGVKGTVYGLLLWLPIYLQDKGLKTEAAFICSMSEIGTLLGGILLGYLIDKFKMQSTCIVIFLFINSIIMLIIYCLPEGTAAPYFFFCLLSGISIGGPYVLLGGAIAIDLAQQEEVKKSKNIIALLAGLIEGFGSFIAAIVQIIVPYFGQDHIFVLFTLICLLSCLFLLKKAIKEIKQKQKEKEKEYVQ